MLSSKIQKHVTHSHGHKSGIATHNEHQQARGAATDEAFHTREDALRTSSDEANLLSSSPLAKHAHLE